MAPRLFPLPLTPFERHMLNDEAPGYPMTCMMQMGMVGTMDRQLFSNAFADVVRQHPLLRARIDGASSGRPRWVEYAEKESRLHWPAERASESRIIRDPMDPTQEPGFRLVVFQDGQRTRVTMVYHHACCDGIGAGRFLDDLLTAYHRRATGAPSPTAEAATDVPRLLRRGRAPLMGWFPVRLTQEIRTFVKEGHHWLCHPVTPLGRPQSPLEQSPDNDSLSDYPTHVLSETESAVLLTLARQLGVTLNDFLLTALFQTLEDWNARYAPETVTPWLRISVPQNLREEADRRLPAANKVTMCFLTRTHAVCRQPTHLLASIHREMASARRWLRGKGLLRAFHLLQTIPGLADKVLRRGRCLCTTVMSNLGDYDRWFGNSLPREGRLLRCGDLRLQTITALSPVRPKTHAAFFLASYAGQLQISLRRDPHTLTQDQAQQLLAQFLEHIRNLAQEWDASAPTGG